TLEYKGLIYSTNGRIVKEFEVPKGLQSIMVDLSSIPSGVYFLLLKSKGQFAIVKKFIFYR
ncbi:MAG: T9SS type A sorting domain-containing protein, partial [candidate division WOR-3 bacterium]